MNHTLPHRQAHAGLVTAAARLNRHPVRDAWLDIDLAEHQRRQKVGLSAVTD